MEVSGSRAWGGHDAELRAGKRGYHVQLRQHMGKHFLKHSGTGWEGLLVSHRDAKEMEKQGFCPGEA